MRPSMRARPLASLLLVLSAAGLARAADHGADAVQPEEHTGLARSSARGDTSSPFGNALRLARMLNDDRVVARLLATRAVAPGVTTEELQEMSESLEAVGDPEVAARFLEQRLRAFPHED